MLSSNYLGFGHLAFCPEKSLTFFTLFDYFNLFVVITCIFQIIMKILKDQKFKIELVHQMDLGTAESKTNRSLGSVWSKISTFQILYWLH